jgi:hypothetical protein
MLTMGWLIRSALGRYVFMGATVGSATAGLWLVGFSAGSGTVSAWSVLVAVGAIAGTTGAFVAFGAMSHGRLPTDGDRPSAGQRSRQFGGPTSVKSEPEMASATSGVRAS